jgi:L-alanine-DL-glutamate epimerase-like enolase superfamily enzyme
MMVNTIRSVTDTIICVDANQGWKDKHYALDMIHWLNERNVNMIEQPMPKLLLDEAAWVTENSPLPVIADEACQRLTDIPKLKGAYHGVNIKLMKCTGMREAREMISLAKALHMRLMIGCMTETSCAISAAAQLAPETEWADLDGNLLISNDVYKGMLIVDGKITLNDLPGIGISKL